MRHHTILCRLGVDDTSRVSLQRRDTLVTELPLIDSDSRLDFGLGQALDQLRELGVHPSEIAIDFVVLAAAVTAADTRISRATEAQDFWTREIGLVVPVSDPQRWTQAAPLLVRTLNFLTGDRWALQFRRRPARMKALSFPPEALRTASPTCVCLFSGGLDSFIGAIDLLAKGERPLLVSHYWDGVTSTHQTYCAAALVREFPRSDIQHMRARVGFPASMVDGSPAEDTLRARSFLFFALAAMAADALGGSQVIHVPENGLISLNVPLDPLRLGALSTRTTHPYYMARVQELFSHLGLSVALHNSYAFKTKGEMMKECRNPKLIRKVAHHTMSCSHPANARFALDPTRRDNRHCGSCVPCIIRRAAFAVGLGEDKTPYAIDDLAAQTLDSEKAEGEHVRSFQLALAKLKKRPDRARFDIHRPGPFVDHPDHLPDYLAVYQRGMAEVGRYVAKVKAEPK